MPTTPTLTEVIEGALDARLESVNTAEPGTIVSFNKDTCTANVQPTIKRLYTREDGTEYAASPPVIPNVPIMFPGSGPDDGITFPILKGHTVLLVYCQPSLDAWKLSADKQVAPKKFAPHAMSNAVAIVGLRTMTKAREAPAAIIHPTASVWNSEDIRLGSPEAADRVALRSDLTILLSAITNAATAANDGGASFKAAILAALSAANWPTCSLVVKAD